MSLQLIKTNLETFLYSQITNIPIKGYNTNIYTLNGTPVDITDYTSFIEPRVVPIEQDQALISTDDKYLTRAFFQVSIFNKVNSGTGDSLTLETTLNNLFRNQKIGVDDICCRNSSVVPAFQDGEWSVLSWRCTCEIYNS